VKADYVVVVRTGEGAVDGVLEYAEVGDAMDHAHIYATKFPECTVRVYECVAEIRVKMETEVIEPE
jgi:hypothetical protein